MKHTCVMKLTSDDFVLRSNRSRPPISWQKLSLSNAIAKAKADNPLNRIAFDQPITRIRPSTETSVSSAVTHFDLQPCDARNKNSLLLSISRLLERF